MNKHKNTKPITSAGDEEALRVFNKAYMENDSSCAEAVAAVCRHKEAQHQRKVREKIDNFIKEVSPVEWLENAIRKHFGGV